MVRTTALSIFAVLTLGACPALAAQPGAACAGPPSVGAINQYCENIPGATGGHPSGPGTPAVSSSLPRRVVKRLTATGHARLLALPAAVTSSTPSRRGRAPSPVRPQQSGISAAASTDPLSPFILLLVALIALTLALMAAALIRRRRVEDATTS